MPKSNLKPGVSRQVRYSLPGSGGQPQTTILNQSALVRRREAATKIQSDLLQGSSFSAVQATQSYTTEFLPHLGLTVDEKRVLEEFSGPPNPQPVDNANPSPVEPEGETWQDLRQEGITQGFIDDIQGLLEGK